jgi:RNA polymerase sigma-70 factor (ECF subfamily)
MATGEAHVLATLRKPSVSTEVAELGRIFEEHHARLCRAAYRITGSASDAEDVLQNVFLRLARTGDGPEPGGNLEGYLYRAAINTAVDLVRARRRQPTSGPDSEAAIERTASGAGPGDEIELRGWLRQALVSLSPRQAEMFVLRYLEGYDNREIAQLLDTSRAVVAVSLFRARRQLQKELGALAGGTR